MAAPLTLPAALLCLAVLSARPASATVTPEQQAQWLYEGIGQRLLSHSCKTVDLAGLPLTVVQMRAKGEPAGCPSVGVLASEFNLVCQGSAAAKGRQKAEEDLLRCFSSTSTLVWIPHRPRKIDSKKILRAFEQANKLNMIGGDGAGVGGGGGGKPSPLKKGSQWVRHPSDYPVGKPVPEARPQEEPSLFPDPRKVKDVLDLQVFKTVQKVALPDGGRAELVNLNPKVGRWYLLTLFGANGAAREAMNLEVADGGSGTPPKLALEGNMVKVVSAEKSAPCPLWHFVGKTAELSWPKSADFYSPVCAGTVLMLRPENAGSQEMSASVSGTLHSVGWLNNFWNWVKQKTGVANGTEKLKGKGARADGSSTDGPADAELGMTSGVQSIKVSDTDLSVALKDASTLQYGRWYETKNHPGIYISLMTSGAASHKVSSSYTDRVEKTDSEDAAVYLAAFDMSHLGLGYKTASDNEQLTWAASGYGSGLKGPDGIDNPAPLSTNGLIPPDFKKRTVSAFKAGYGPWDMAMAGGAMSNVNRGSHWGVIENGVVFRRPSAGLATVVVYTDGSFDMLTWPQDDRKLLPRIRDLRQNETSIVDGHDKNGVGVPGPYVGGKDFDNGNWASSANNDPRRREGICMASNGGKKFLIFAYFTGGEPSNMTRVFQAYGCDYGMQLDINIRLISRLPFYSQDSEGNPVASEFLHKDGEGFGDIYTDKSERRDFFYVYKK